MSNPADKRILGLSPRARRFVIPFLIIAALAIAISYVLGGETGESSGIGTGPVVRGDLHLVAALDSRVFVAGHGGASYRDHKGG